MRRRAFVVSAILAGSSLPLPLLAQHESHKLGTIVFPNSGNQPAQQPFLRGVALLHSFEYESAAEAFREAQKADPALALAYWGEALTYSHVLWRTEDLPASRAALSRLAPTSTDRLAKARTPRERSFGVAVEKFYEQGSLAQRARAYADAMRQHSSGAPGEQEAAAFASHALMVAAYQMDGAARDEYLREAVKLAQKVAIANPDHPGATHYLIHLYDSPGMAAQGLTFARAYDKIAPDAEHALHMPSHIYLQLGLWDDVARSNERAWAASRATTTNPGDLDWHAFSWLHYAYLQQGRWRAARGLIDTARTLLGSGNLYADAAFAVTRLEFQQHSETGQESASLTRPPLASGEQSERERGFRQMSAYWVAVTAARNGEQNLHLLAAPFIAVADSIRAGAVRPPAAATNALVVKALEAGTRDDSTTAFKALRDGVAFEKKLNAFVGPPERVFAGEVLTLELLNQARDEHHFEQPERRKALREAIDALENVLRLCPNRSQTLFLLGAAKVLDGDKAGAVVAFRKLSDNYANADAEMQRKARGALSKASEP